jgi:GNAT superfamily N-acetyltransferase
LKRAWGNELCGVIVYSYPPPSSFGRRLVLPKMTMSEMNQKLSSISRVVIHPKYRTIGLGAKLIRETLPLAGTEFVEMSAVMSKYNPFAEKAGMKKVVEQGASEQATKILHVLEELGFDKQLLGSEKYVSEKVKGLNNDDLLKVKNAFASCQHPRFLKSFSWHQPYGISSAYKELVYSADLEKVASLVKICGFLLQTKVYLFWRSERNSHKNVVE